MLLEKLLKEFNFSINTFNLEESKLFDRYFERILIGKDTFLIKEGEIERYSYFVYDGMLRCDHKEDLMTKLIEASKYDRHIVVEECVDCIELETAVLGNDDPIVSRVGQIMPHGEFYTFESKYEDEESKTCIPALVDQEIQDKIREYALRVFKAVDGHGLSRVDFFLDKKSNQIYLNEINTLPGFTKISMYPQLMNDFGISYSELLDRVIQLAFDK